MHKCTYVVTSGLLLIIFYFTVTDTEHTDLIVLGFNDF